MQNELRFIQFQVFVVVFSLHHTTNYRTLLHDATFSESVTMPVGKLYSQYRRIASILAFSTNAADVSSRNFYILNIGFYDCSDWQKVQVDNDQEMAQSERDSHSTTQGKKLK